MKPRTIGRFLSLHHFPICEGMAAVTQLSLFPTGYSAQALPGLTYVSEGITADEERQLANFIAALDFKAFEFRGFTGNRRTVSFGWRYDFNGGGFQTADALPAQLQRVRSCVADRLGLTANDFEQCSVIEYAPGAGIGWHRDRSHFGKVAGISLLAPCVCAFGNRAKAERGTVRPSCLNPVRFICSTAKRVMAGSIRSRP
jgi:alkylated DNA repair dioxygenase AlkB